MLGLPYANPSDLELRTRMAHLDTSPTAFTGQQLYEAKCMNAVNQAIGRVIRHKADHAAVILCDSRFAAGATDAASAELSRAPVSKLPKWMKPSLDLSRQDYAYLHLKLAAFCRQHNRRTIAA
ncbi:helicase ATP-binding domain-containing protein [Haematococcus lacustris]|uniref:Helicase ATP-binding domain-containing protein n=1 Tax=Haematococcus lacustris TaxID=44745 RepID=A0A699ZP45_HAELA|nr:helicase ATP-binding domain-containing protein [Haematococcus lacustris]